MASVCVLYELLLISGLTHNNSYVFHFGFYLSVCIKCFFTSSVAKYDPVSVVPHKHIQPFYSSLDFVRDNPGESVPEETFTHSHLSRSSVIPSSASSIYYDPWHLPCSIYVTDSLFFTISVQVFFGNLLAWHPPLPLNCK